LSVSTEPASTDRPVLPKAVWRLRLAVCSAALAALAFLQVPGRISPDSKLDLTVNPLGFLGRASQMWEPLGFFGQVQNQAYGYAWPVGPFFAAGDLAGLDPWVVQRLWLSVLLVVAFLGFVRLTGALGIGTPLTRIIAGFAFALSPRLMTTLGPISVEALPTCVAPWVLIPLTRVGRGLSPRRAAVLSGLAFACASGVNAVAAIATLVLPGLWILTRTREVRWRLAGWWSLAIVLASAWWAVPLLLLGRYSSPFLGYIETAAVTTAPTTLVNTLRGASHWVAYLSVDGQPVWPGGWTLINIPILVLDTVLIAALGIVGLAAARLTERHWLVLGVVAGVVLVTFGHVGPLASPVAGMERELLDGALAPFRNVHKFDPVLRLPLVLGLCALLASGAPKLGLSWPRFDPGSYGAQARRLAVLVTVAAVLGGAMPVLTNRLYPTGAFDRIPDHWSAAAGWLDRNAGDRRALLVPGARFGDYLWGRPHDEPLQALANSPWGVRDAVPLTPPGTIRLLDAIEARLASGRGSTALADVLARSGVGYLVVRNDLDRSIAQSPRPVLVHAALAASPGISRVASFGPVISSVDVPGTFVDDGLSLRYPAVEIFAVARDVDPVSLRPLDRALAVSGGPEDLLNLLERDEQEVGPVLFAGDLSGAASQLLREGGARSVVTDGFRRREVSFGGVLDGNTSATLAEDDPLRIAKPNRDYLPWLDPKLGTTAVITGAQRVRTSSSASDPDGFSAAQPAHQPYAAIDGSATTSWRPTPDRSAAGEWYEVDFGRVVSLDGTRLLAEPFTPATFVTTPASTQVEVSIDGTPVGSLTVTDGAPTELPTQGRSGRRLRIRVESVGDALGRFGIAELSVPDVTVRKVLRTPPAPVSGPLPAVVLATAEDGRSGCVQVGPRPLCTEALATPGEEDDGLYRWIALSRSGVYRAEAAAVPRLGPGLDALLTGVNRHATASTSEVKAPLAGAAAAFDDDVTTAWIAGGGDQQPKLELSWQGARTVSGVQIVLDPAVSAAQARVVEVEVAGERHRVQLGEDGRATIPPVRTDRLALHIVTLQPVRSFDLITNAVSIRPVGISEVRLTTDTPLPPPDSDSTPISVPCGQGPEVTVGGVTLQTAVETTRGALRNLEEVRLAICGRAEIGVIGGDVPAYVGAAAAFRGTRLWLDPTQGPGASPRSGGGLLSSAPDVRTVEWSAEYRELNVGSRGTPTILSVAENTNPGWTATLDGRRLEPLVVDGWRQGWLVPAGGAGQIELTYQPGRAYRAALGIGFLGLFALVLMALRRRRPYTGPAATPAPVGEFGAFSVTALFVLATGVVGAVALVAARLLRAWSGPRAGILLGAWAAASFVLAGVATAFDFAPLPWLDQERGAAALCVLALGCVVSTVLPSWPERPDWNG
jgi:arabinofuranan 3-O-arabinosyltransferase